MTINYNGFLAVEGAVIESMVTLPHSSHWETASVLGKRYHGKHEYARWDAYSKTAESWIALLKRGIVGTFHHVSEQHLDRYVDEFAFRWDNRSMSDGQRMVEAVKGIEGKRLVYKDTINNNYQDS